MAGSVIRRVAGIAAGIVAGGVVVALCESLGHLAFPPPPGLDLADPADQARLMDVVPFGAKLAVIAAWFCGALAGAWTAVRIARWAAAAWIIAAVMIGLGVLTTQMFPHPWWMVAAAIAMPAFAAWLVRQPGATA
jgi:hypothetical protein